MRNQKALESIQNKAARFATRDYSRESSVSAMKTQLGWPSLQSRRTYRDLTMWYKIHYGLVRIVFPPVVTLATRQTRHGHELSYVQILPRVDCFKYSYFVRTIPAWNVAPDNAVYAASVTTFQRLVLAQIGSRQP